MAKVDLTDATFKSEVLDSKGLVLVDAWAPWCGPCLMLNPIIDEIAQDNSDLKIGKLNVDENQETSINYQIVSIPTIMLFKDGALVETFIGVQPKQRYTDAIAKHKS